MSFVSEHVPRRTGDFSLVDGQFQNNFFPGSQPQVLHFNGNATGIDYWLKDIHGV